MSFIEFIEAIARACDYLSLGPPSYYIREAYKDFIFKAEIKSPQLESQKFSKTELSKLLETEDLKNDDDEFLKNEEGAFLSREEHISQPLHSKIENIIPYLLTYCTSLSFKKRWRWPRKNPHTGLYTDVKKQMIKDIKMLMVRGFNKLIFSRLNLIEIVKTKGLNIKIRGI